MAFGKIYKLYKKLCTLAETYLWPVLNLGIRLFMAKIFFVSGWLRFKDYMNGQWQNQITAFTEYHPIPFIPGEIAAIMGTGGELILPALLASGLLTRIGAGGLLLMTMMIQFAVPADYGVGNADHYMWMLLLAVPLLKGGGPLSLDFLICRFTCKKRS
tara:strand:- start:1193 stop:1666 length:474 start_codon:yes stop_codon:yes gene_type:complete